MSKNSLLETFCIRQGEIQNLHYHKWRVCWTADELGLKHVSWDSFMKALESELLHFELSSEMLYRCSVTYNDNGVQDVHCIPYTPKFIKQLIPKQITTNIYPYKWSNRAVFEPFRRGLNEGEEPLLLLDGNITDTTYTNLVFERPDGVLVTPQRPLLRGTQRERLIREEGVRQDNISLADIRQFRAVHLINAMLSLGELVLPIASITAG